MANDEHAALEGLGEPEKARRFSWVWRVVWLVVAFAVFEGLHRVVAWASSATPAAAPVTTGLPPERLNHQWVEMKSVTVLAISRQGDVTISVGTEGWRAEGIQASGTRHIEGSLICRTHGGSVGMFTADFVSNDDVKLQLIFVDGRQPELVSQTLTVVR